MFGGEVFADHGNHADLGEVACGQREISCRAAKAPVAPALRRLDAVKCNTAYYQNGHGFFLTYAFGKVFAQQQIQLVAGSRRKSLPGW